MQDWYKKQIETSVLKQDEHQQQLISYLDQIAIEYEQKYLKWGLFKKNHIILDGNSGIYIYGSVGRGKSIILNQFFENIPSSKKIRWHFHEFMQHVQGLHANLNQKKPLEKIAAKLKLKYNIMYLDEFEITDIATAMIVGNLLSALKKVGIFILTTSNTAPDHLYLNGLMRQRFLPTIDYLNNNFKIYNLDGTNDYRYNNYITQSKYNKVIQLPSSYKVLEDTFNFYVKNSSHNLSAKITINEQSKTIFIQNRYIKYQDIILNVGICFSCEDLCRSDRSVADYIELCSSFNVFMISDIPQFDCNNCDINYALRLSWLIDIIYDQAKTLIISSKHNTQDIYINDTKLRFRRTISRLTQLVNN